MTGEKGLEVLLLLRYATALVAAVAPTEHICTGIYQERYLTRVKPRRRGPGFL